MAWRTNNRCTVNLMLSQKYIVWRHIQRMAIECTSQERRYSAGFLLMHRITNFTSKFTCTSRKVKSLRSIRVQVKPFSSLPKKDMDSLFSVTSKQRDCITLIRQSSSLVAVSVTFEKSNCPENSNDDQTLIRQSQSIRNRFKLKIQLRDSNKGDVGDKYQMISVEYHRGNDSESYS